MVQFPYTKQLNGFFSFVFTSTGMVSAWTNLVKDYFFMLLPSMVDLLFIVVQISFFICYWFVYYR